MTGLTTNEATFIEDARHNGQLFIHQPYDLYSDANHQTWRTLYTRMQPRWDRYANQAFREGIAALGLDANAIPQLSHVNGFLKPLTGFEAKPVSGYVPASLFFECLRRRHFPTTITIRRSDKLDYLPEPDIFHDIAGHVPMHTNRAFADTLVRFGDCARSAAGSARDTQELKSIVRALARFFWFTVEFGLMRAPTGLWAYGSGLLSSFGEIEHAIESPKVQRFPMQMEWVINQVAEIDHYQPLLFIVDSFEHLYELVGELESWMKQGKLSNVAPGDPQVSDADLDSFHSAAA